MAERTRQPRRSPAVAAARAAAREIGELIDKEPLGTTMVESTDDGWRVGIEVVEDRHVPSSNDMLGLYVVDVDDDGNLLSYRRVDRYPRSRGGSGEVDR